MYKNIVQRNFNTKRLLVRIPSPHLTNGIVEHIPRQKVNYIKALEQWTNYCQIFRNAGWKIHEIPPPTATNDCPDSVFIEDTLIICNGENEKQCAIITRPGHITRQIEIHNMPIYLKQIEGFEYKIFSIKEPGILDGGDILQVGNTIYVGHSTRTNLIAIDQLRTFLSSYGIMVIPIPISKVLHLKSAATALPCGTIIYWPDALTEREIATFKHAGAIMLPVPEERGCNVVVLDKSTVLISQGADKTIHLLSQPPFHLSIIVVNIDEFIKLEGCVTCLSVRVPEYKCMVANRG